MDTLTAILTRRSIRKYINKPIEEPLVEMLLKSAQYAPTARNLQPWHFIVFREKENLIQLASIHPHGKMLVEAGLAILVCGNKHIDETESYLIQNCSAATQNILLAAHALGLGAVWLGVHPRPDRMKGIIDFLSLPEHIVPISLISIGWPNEKPSQPVRFNPEKVSYEKW